MKSREKDAIIKEINDALAKTLEEFASSENLPFGNDADLKRFLYDKGYFQSSSWDKSNTCMYKDCTNKSVKSHTIQKSTSLKYIAEDNHVLTPGFNVRTEKYELLLTGINDASTFPGFCPVHEKLFSRFEQSGEFNEDVDIRLQIYRTVCREIMANQRALRSQEYRLYQYLNFRNKKFDQMVKEKIRHLRDAEIQFKGTSYKHLSAAEYHMTQGIKSVKNYLDRVLYPFHEQLLNDIEKDKIQKVYIKGIIIDTPLPCCLAGSSSFRINNKKTGTMFVNILPYPEKTYFVIASQIKNKRWIDRYIALGGQHAFSLISMTENWMIHNSDHWFLKPSIWYALDKKIQHEILQQIVGMGDEVSDDEVMIFTELRKSLISYYENEKGETSGDLLEVLELEKKKLEIQVAKFL